jgi:hypothetical protein
MASQLRPLSAVEPGEVMAYLKRQGMAEEVVRWKYFDRSPLPEHERAQVAIQDGSIAGFIGLIPFTTPQRLRAAWTCDWCAEAHAGASGIGLLSACLKVYDALYQLGGNERTQAILGKLARRTIPGAGIEYYLPLRLGAYLRPLARRTGLTIHRKLEQIPLRRGGSTGLQGTVRPGLGFELGALFAAGNGSNPRYSLEHLTWQIGRCPVLSCYTCLAPGRDPDAAILLWTSRTDGGNWRMAPIFREQALPALQAALALAIRHVHEARGLRLSLLVSHRDERLRRLIEDNGFLLARERRMMNVLTRAELVESADELTTVSFLDSDMAYRL